MNEVVETKVVLDGVKGYSIDITGNFDDDSEEIYYHHILTGQLNESLGQCFTGWSEQNCRATENWIKLCQGIEALGEELNQIVCDSDGKAITVDSAGNWHYQKNNIGGQDE